MVLTEEELVESDRIIELPGFREFEKRFEGKTIFERIKTLKQMIAEIGEQKATEIAGKYHTKKWLKEFAPILKKNNLSGDPFKDVIQLIYIDFLKLMPYEFSVEKKPNQILLKCFNRCPIYDACTALGMDTATVCCKVFNQPMQALVSAVNPKLLYQRVPAWIRPRHSYCFEKIFI